MEKKRNKSSTATLRAKEKSILCKSVALPALGGLHVEKFFLLVLMSFSQLYLFSPGDNNSELTGPTVQTKQKQAYKM